MPNSEQIITIFIIISLLLIAIIGLFQLIQFCFWLTVVLKYKNKKPNQQLYYQALLATEILNCQIKKQGLAIKFLNYNLQQNTLKFKNRDFSEATPWNIYHTLSSVLIIKWKNNYQRHRHLTLWFSNCFFLVGVINTIICALLFYLPLWTNTDSDLNQTVLAIFSFLGLLMIVLSWLFWTMNYEKFRKELLALATVLDAKTYRIIKIITLYKALFPLADLGF